MNFIFDLEEKILKILCSGSGNVMGVVKSFFKNTYFLVIFT